jgi:hypothetical protein
VAASPDCRGKVKSKKSKGKIQNRRIGAELGVRNHGIFLNLKITES